MRVVLHGSAHLECPHERGPAEVHGRQEAGRVRTHRAQLLPRGRLQQGADAVIIQGLGLCRGRQHVQALAADLQRQDSHLQEMGGQAGLSRGIGPAQHLQQALSILALTWTADAEAMWALALTMECARVAAADPRCRASWSSTQSPGLHGTLGPFSSAEPAAIEAEQD